VLASNIVWSEELRRCSMDGGRKQACMRLKGSRGRRKDIRIGNADEAGRDEGIKCMGGEQDERGSNDKKPGGRAEGRNAC